MSIKRAIYLKLVRPVLFAFDAEKIHDNLKIILVALGKFKFTRFVVRKLFRFEHKMLNTTVDGNHYDNPIMVSAGFDKNADLSNIIGEFGFGGIEVGSITGEHCDGNPKPRVHRAKTTGTGSVNVWNGLNNYGAKVLAPKIKKEFSTMNAVGGISAAMLNFDGSISEGIEDYLKTVRAFAGIGKFLVVNISCPNTLQGEPFMDPTNLSMLLKEINSLREATNDTKPMYVKINPDMTSDEIISVVDVCAKFGVQGIVTTNLTKLTNQDVQDSLSAKDLEQFKKDNCLHRGGMSGELVREKSKFTQLVVANRIKEKSFDMVILGVGGITTAEDAYWKIRNGASLLLLVTSFIFEGPSVVGEINEGLVKLLKRDGFNSISEAVGVDLK